MRVAVRLPARRVAVACLAALLVAGSGCFNYPEERCRGCVIVDHAHLRLPRVRRGSRTVVVLVGGALGFGDEWDLVVAALRAQPAVDFVVFDWPGSFRSRPEKPALALGGLLQALLDRAPAAVGEVVVLAHSAGGMLADYAARLLRVPAGRRLRVASVAAPDSMKATPYVIEESAKTPIGLPVAASGKQAAYPPIPPGVEITDYVTDDAPKVDAPPRRVYMGRTADHNGVLATVVVPLIQALH